MKALKFLHRWLGIPAVLFILFFAVSGIILNHRVLFSSVDVNRKYLPATYHYNNWNLSAVKSALEIGGDSLLIYGNIGIWLTDTHFSHYTPYMQGMRRGADNRRTNTMIKTADGRILAGTLSGLWELRNNKWQQVRLPGKENRITGMIQTGDSIYITTRSHLLIINHNGAFFEARQRVLPHPTDYRRETSLFRALWVIHSGKILGLPGKLLVDFMALVMIFLCMSGIIWFAAPDLMKSMKQKPLVRKRLAKLNRFSLKWHNTLGIWALGFLILLTLTGMFLRPPLLISIVRSSFPALKYTILDHPNPWYDKLRDIQYDRLKGKFIFSTSEGFYTVESNFSDSLHRIPHQPPISIMGINVFEQLADGIYITGSFSGIHHWVPSAGQVHDYISGAPVSPARGMANPFGSIPVAGFIKLNTGAEFLFDYNAGVVSLNRQFLPPPMPDEIRKQSSMSLWNLALEVHTGRFYSFIFGKYYILFIPFAGMIILTILLSGGYIWWRNQRKKSDNCKNTRADKKSVS